MFAGRLETLETRALLNATVAADLGGAPIQVSRQSAQVSSSDTLTVAVDSPGRYIPAAGAYAVDDAKPFISGVASSPTARVFVYATPRRGAPILIGQTTPDSASSWGVTSNVPLADGLYTIQAQAVDDSTHTAGALTPMATKLIVDTVGPRVVGVQFVPRLGQIVVTYRDFGGDRNAGTGLDLSTVTYPLSYAFLPLTAPWTGGSSQPPWEATSAIPSPTWRDGPLRVVVTINDGAPIPTGSYRLIIRSPLIPVTPSLPYPYFVHIPYFVLGVTDGSGNPLNGGATSTIAAPDSNDFATGLTVLHGRGFPASRSWAGSMRS